MCAWGGSNVENGRPSRRQSLADASASACKAEALGAPAIPPSGRALLPAKAAVQIRNSRRIQAFPSAMIKQNKLSLNRPGSVEGPVVALKAALAAVAAAAIVIGFALPARHGDDADARSQIPTIELHP